MHLPRVENVTFWRATRCGLSENAQKRQKKTEVIFGVFEEFSANHDLIADHFFRNLLNPDHDLDLIGDPFLTK